MQNIKILNIFSVNPKNDKILPKMTNNPEPEKINMRSKSELLNKSLIFLANKCFTANPNPYKNIGKYNVKTKRLKFRQKISKPLS